MSVRKIVSGDLIHRPSVLNRPIEDMLTGSGYLADGSDFAGFVNYPVLPGEVGVTNTLYPAGDVRRYGAKNDTSDAYAGIQAAINAAATLSVDVVIPGGTWRLSQSLTMPDTVAILVCGAGMGVTILQARSAMTNVLFKSNTGTPVGSGLRDLSIDGFLLATRGFEFQRGKQWKIERVQIYATVGDGAWFGENTTGFAGFFGSIITDLFINFEPTTYPTPSTRPDYNARFLGTATDNHITNFVGSNAKTAGILNEGGSNTFVSWHIYGFPLLTYYPQYAIRSDGGQFISVGGYSDGVSIAGISLFLTSTATITGNRFYWPSGGSVVGAYPVKVEDTSSTNITVIGNTMIGEDVGITRFVNWPTGNVLSGSTEAFNAPQFGTHAWRGSINVRGFNSSSNAEIFLTTVGTGKNAVIRAQDTNGERWNFGKDNTTESGSNVGSNYFIERCNDAGSAIDRPFKINRVTGQVQCVVGGVLTGVSVTGSRPSASTLGQGSFWYDTTLLKPIFSDGTNWRDGAGTVV